jgi:hypothetical protein
MKSLVLGFSLILLLTVHAKEITILDVRNNSVDEKYDYKMVLDVDKNNKITKLYVDSYLKGNHQAGLQSRDTKPISNIKTGIVLVKRQGYNLAILKSPNFIYDVGGEMELFYLYRGSLSGSGGTYRKKDMSLLSHGDNWQVYDSVNNDIEKASLVVNKLFGIEVGIKEIYFK